MKVERYSKGRVDPSPITHKKNFKEKKVIIGSESLNVIVMRDIKFHLFQILDSKY